MQRVIDLAGCLNFRDLGGCSTEDGRRVRWRQVFRADGLHLLTQEDVDRLRDELGVRDVIDLRSTAERGADPPRPLDRENAIRVHHLPLFDGDTNQEQRSGGSDLSLADRYLALVEIARGPIAQTLRVIAESEGTSVYHCAAGKDRTGVVSAVLLGVLGVRPDVIVADYAATKQNLDQIIDRLMQTGGYSSVLGNLPADTLHAEPETMRSLLEGLRLDHGSVQDYAKAAGVSDATLERLEARLLERA